jgi:hypothetical protein
MTDYPKPVLAFLSDHREMRNAGKLAVGGYEKPKRIVTDKLAEPSAIATLEMRRNVHSATG